MAAYSIPTKFTKLVAAMPLKPKYSLMSDLVVKLRRTTSGNDFVRCAFCGHEFWANSRKYIASHLRGCPGAVNVPGDLVCDDFARVAHKMGKVLAEEYLADGAEEPGQDSTKGAATAGIKELWGRHSVAGIDFRVLVAAAVVVDGLPLSAFEKTGLKVVTNYLVTMGNIGPANELCQLPSARTVGRDLMHLMAAVREATNSVLVCNRATSPFVGSSADEMKVIQLPCSRSLIHFVVHTCSRPVLYKVFDIRNQRGDAATLANAFRASIDEVSRDTGAIVSSITTDAAFVMTAAKREVARCCPFLACVSCAAHSLSNVIRTVLEKTEWGRKWYEGLELVYSLVKYNGDVRRAYELQLIAENEARRRAHLSPPQRILPEVVVADGECIVGGGMEIGEGVEALGAEVAEDEAVADGAVDERDVCMVAFTGEAEDVGTGGAYSVDDMYRASCAAAAESGMIFEEPPLTLGTVGLDDAAAEAAEAAEPAGDGPDVIGGGAGGGGAEARGAEAAVGGQGRWQSVKILQATSRTRWTSVSNGAAVLRDNKAVLERTFCSLLPGLYAGKAKARLRYGKEKVADSQFWAETDALLPTFQLVSRLVDQVQGDSATLSDVYGAIVEMDAHFNNADTVRALGPKYDDLRQQWAHFKEYIDDPLVYLARALDPVARFERGEDSSMYKIKALQAVRAVPCPLDLVRPAEAGGRAEWESEALRSIRQVFTSGDTPELKEAVRLFPPSAPDLRHPLAWWCELKNSRAAPYLDDAAYVASYVFSIAPTSAVVERTFSLSTASLPDQRRRTKSETVARCVRIREHIRGDPDRLRAVAKRASELKHENEKAKRKVSSAAESAQKRARVDGLV